MKKYILILACLSALGLYSCDGGNKANVSTNSVDSSNVKGTAPVEYNSPKENSEPLVDTNKSPRTNELPANTKPDQEKKK